MRNDFVQAGAEKGGTRMKWEYTTVKLAATGFWVGGRIDEGQLDRMTNELGAQGLELASALGTQEAYGNTRDVVAIFKRPAG